MDTIISARFHRASTSLSLLLHRAPPHNLPQGFSASHSLSDAGNACREAHHGK